LAMRTGQYLIKWRGFDEPTWEPEENVANSATAVMLFHETQQRRERRKRDGDAAASRLLKRPTAAPGCRKRRSDLLQQAQEQIRLRQSLREIQTVTRRNEEGRQKRPLSAVFQRELGLRRQNCERVPVTPPAVRLTDSAGQANGPSFVAPPALVKRAKRQRQLQELLSHELGGRPAKCGRRVQVAPPDVDRSKRQRQPPGQQTVRPAKSANTTPSSSSAGPLTPPPPPPPSGGGGRGSPKSDVPPPGDTGTL
jgi:hypothetical protein